MFYLYVCNTWFAILCPTAIRINQAKTPSVIMAKQLTLFLSISILHFTNAEIIDCATQIESCNCSTTATPGETCILNCNSKDICKGKTLNCRPGDPCVINCESSASCSDNAIINAETSTDVSILCEGTDACKKGINIKCGIGKCKLQCDTDSSCNDWGNINVTNSISFECIGYCPSESLLPKYFSESPTNIPTILPTIYTINPTDYPTSNPTILPTNNPSTNPTITTSISPTYTPNISLSNTTQSTHETIVKQNNIDNKSTTKRGIKFHDHEHYLTDPLFYMITTLLIIILCAFCCLCIWIYSKEQQQKRIKYKLNSKPLENIHLYNNYSNSNSMSNHMKKKVKSNKKYSINSTPHPSIDNSSELYTKNEGQLPTYLKINTIDLHTHSSIMARSNPIKPNPILLPSQINNNNTRYKHQSFDGSVTKPLPMPPPRKSLPRNTSIHSGPLSPYGIISNFSSPANTPIPETPIINNIISYNYKYDKFNKDINDIKDNISIEQNDMDDIKYNENENIHFDLKQLNKYNKLFHHCQYASLPTIPSLPTITPEHSISYTEMNLHSSTNNSNYNILQPNTSMPNNNPQLHGANNSLHSIKISMISCMEYMDDNKDNNEENTITRYSNEMSESMEYESHRKQTFESYDMGTSNSFIIDPRNKSLKQIHGIHNTINNEPFVIGNVSTIKLHDISEKEESNKSESIVSSFSETSVGNVQLNNHLNDNDDDDDESCEENLVEKDINDDNIIDCDMSDVSSSSAKL
eukprot:527060_1